jgi:hypothetical protein
VLHQIGNGALGPVFRAYDQDRDRLVAVKLFRLDLPPERVHQLLGEFEKLIAAELQHPVIASPRAAGIDGNSAYLAQDFAAADSLDIVIRENGPAPPAQVGRIAGQIADALDYAADRQIVHGSLHPRDILLSDDDIRIVGLGVARALERVEVTVPVRLPYAPPERINDVGWDRTADVFSLAAIVYELLCGKRITGIGSEAAESIGEVPGADVEALQRVFALALAADPAYRYATATAFTDALKDAMGIDVAPAKPKAKRAKPKLKVVQADPSEPALPLTLGDVEGLDEVAEVPEVLEVLEVLEVPEESVVRAPRRRRAPAPTPVAIETAGIVPIPEPELAIELEPFVELEAVADLAVAADLPPEFAPVEPQAVEEIVLLSEDEPPAFASIEPDAIDEIAIEPEPMAALAFEPEPEAVVEPEPVAAPDAPTPDPVFIAPPMPPASSPVWPIGVAAMIGIALGFGAGYMIAIRDRAVVPAAAATTAPPATTAAVVQTPVVAQAVSTPPAPATTANVADVPAFSGRVLVRSTPSGARVAVDGKDRGQTPATIRELGRGEHRVRVTRDGYATVDKRIVLSPSQPSQSWSIALAKAAGTTASAAAAAGGVLIVESRPQGAAVVVDGRRVGTTPLSIADVQAGTHAIRIERDGYRIWTAGVNISAGAQNRVTASLEK